MTRHEARIQALQLVFEMEFSREAETDELFETAQLCRDITPDDYARSAVAAVRDNLDDIDAKIDAFSSTWRASRLSKPTLAIMRLAIAEMEYLHEPAGAIINEAVTLAKDYCGADDPSYINGVLGGYARSLPQSPDQTETAAE